MRRGDLWKKKLTYTKERFQSKEGIFEFFLGSAVWGFIIVSFNKQVFDFFFQLYEPVGIELLRYYLSFTSFSIFFMAVGLGISYAILRVFDEFFGGF